MRVLHVITGLATGGAEHQLRLLLKHTPLDADVLTLTHPGAVAEGLRADGRRVLHLGMGGNRDLGALPRLVRTMRAGRYDVVHTHLYRACVYGRLAARLAGVPAVVATEHSLGETVLEGRRLTPGVRALYLATERMGAATVAVSETVAGRLRRWGVPAGRIRVVPNGIDAARFRFDPAARRTARGRLGLPADAVVVGGVGRLVPGKRFDHLVRACAQLPDTWLLLAGDGPEREALRALAVRLGVQDRLLLAGDTPASALPSLLAATDVLASPSEEESFGLSVLEALAAGLPCVYVTCPAVDDASPSRGAAPGAHRVAPGVPALVRALREVLGRGAERLPVPPVVARYDVAAAATELVDLYEELTPRPRHVPADPPYPRAPVRTRTTRSPDEVRTP